MDTPSGYIKVAQVENFAVSKEMSGAFVRFGPGGLRQLHWHPGHAEWQFVINGTVTVCQISKGIVSMGSRGIAVRI